MHAEWKPRVYGRAVECITCGKRLTPNAVMWICFSPVRRGKTSRRFKGLQAQRWQIVCQVSFRMEVPFENTHLSNHIKIIQGRMGAGWRGVCVKMTSLRLGCHPFDLVILVLINLINLRIDVVGIDVLFHESRE